MKYDETKQCPFCGTPKPSVSKTDGCWQIKCVDGCSVVIGGYYDKAKMIQQWNNRPDNTHGTEIERLRAELALIRQSADSVYKSAFEYAANGKFVIALDTILGGMDRIRGKR